MSGKRDVCWGCGSFCFFTEKKLSIFQAIRHDNICLVFRIFWSFSEWIGQSIGQLKIRILPVSMRVLGNFHEKSRKIYFKGYLVNFSIQISSKSF